MSTAEAGLTTTAREDMDGAHHITAIGPLDFVSLNARPMYWHSCLADDPPCPLSALYDLSQLLETGLDRETLAILVGLTEQGVNPEVCCHHHLSLCKVDNPSERRRLTPIVLMFSTTLRTGRVRSTVKPRSGRHFPRLLGEAGPRPAALAHLDADSCPVAHRPSFRRWQQ